MTHLLRGHIFHAPAAPTEAGPAARHPVPPPLQVDPASGSTHQDSAWTDAPDFGLEVVQDGALLVDDGRIGAIGPFDLLRRRHPDVEVEGEPGDLLLPGLVDGHVHFPQVPVIGAMGLRLLDWLRTRTLPEEAKLADQELARAAARTFLRLLARNGTTSALVFGAHFPKAMDAFFEEAATSGLRIAAGLVVSDRGLRPELHTTPDRARREASELVDRWHGAGRLRYAITPRFALSCTEEMLAACADVYASRDDLLFTTHLNETLDEIAVVAELIPDAHDYLNAYERHGLVGPRSVFAHNVHPNDGEIARLGAAGAAVCHCPSSNAFIGSGLFPMRRHLQASVRVCLGTDVGGGTGFSLLKEGLMAYQGQMLHAQGEPLTPARLLMLATRAGADALGLGDEVGDLTPGSAADVVAFRPPSGSTLEAVVRHAPDARAALAGLFTLAREESVVSTWVAGEPVYRARVS